MIKVFKSLAIINEEFLLTCSCFIIYNTIQKKKKKGGSGNVKNILLELGFLFDESLIITSHLLNQSGEQHTTVGHLGGLGLK